MNGQVSDDERKICSWKDRPFTNARERSTRVEHRILLNSYETGEVDIRHEVKCSARGYDDWTAVEVYEIRQHGIDRVSTANRRWWA